MKMKRVALAVAALLPPLCFLACDNTPDPQPAQCTYNSDCTAPLLCLSGQCKPECAEDIDCTDGAACIEGVCQGGTGGQGGAGGMSSSSSSSGMGGSAVSSSSSTSSGMGGMGGSVSSSSSTSSSTSSGGGSCNNNTMDGTETDVDCGGAACVPCTDGKKCTKSQDCTGGICMSNVCSANYELAVVRNGSGQGSVTSMPAGINCGAQCAATYSSGTQITLTATAAGDSVFAGWSGGGCSGNGPCMLTMDSAKSITSKFDLKPTGMSAWQKAYGTSGFASAAISDFSFDENGNVLLTGLFGGTVDFGGGPITATDGDIIIFKLTPNGTHIWSRRVGTNGSEAAIANFSDGTGNTIVVAELASGTNTDVGGGNNLTCTRSFMAKYAGTTGAHVWSKCLGTGSIETRNVTSDAMGNFVVLGVIYGTVDFGGGPIIADASGSMYLAKFSGTDGSHIWSKKVAPRVGNYYGLSMDTAGNVALVGSFFGTINVGGATLSSNGGEDSWVARYNSMGQHVWSKRYGDTGTDYARGVDFDAAGNLLVTGGYTGAIDFGNGTLTNGGGEDVFLVKLAGSNGSLQWANHFGLSAYEQGRVVSVASDGTIILGGTFNGITDFGTGTINALNGDDVFLVKYDALGTLLWGKPIATNSYDEILSVDTDKDNNSGFSGRFGSYQSTVQKFLP